MEFEDLGSLCTFHPCGTKDYLPFRCPDCHQMFCLDHRTAAAHSCQPGQEREAAKALVAVPKERPAMQSLKVKCTHKGCKRTEIVKISCGLCGGQYCLKHKNYAAHQCPMQHKKTRSVIPPTSRLVAVR